MSLAVLRILTITVWAQPVMTINPLPVEITNGCSLIDVPKTAVEKTPLEILTGSFTSIVLIPERFRDFWNPLEMLRVNKP
jgi:hypothetical protein